jgi:uncharacterized membrane protein YkoI
MDSAAEKSTKNFCLPSCSRHLPMRECLRVVGQYDPNSNEHMKTMKSSITLIAVALLGTSIYLRADELGLEQCPAVVQETIRANARGGDVDDVNSIIIEGRSIYLIEVEVPKKDLKLLVDSDGKLIKTREDFTVAEIPGAVLETATKLVPEEGEIEEIDREVAEGKTTYIVQIDRPKAPDLQLVVAEDGTLISQTEDDD